MNFSTTMSMSFQRQRILNPNLDKTSLLSKLSADNITNMTVSPNKVEETKDRSCKLSRYISSDEMIVETMTHGDQRHMVFKYTR